MQWQHNSSLVCDIYRVLGANEHVCVSSLKTYKAPEVGRFT